MQLFINLLYIIYYFINFSNNPRIFALTTIRINVHIQFSVIRKFMHKPSRGDRRPGGTWCQSAHAQREQREQAKLAIYVYRVVEERARKIGSASERGGDRGRVWPKLANKTAANIAWGSRRAKENVMIFILQLSS